MSSTGTVDVIGATVVWSISVRTATMKKMKTEHSPLIEKAIGSLDPTSKIVIDDMGSGVFTLHTCQELAAENLEDIALPVLLCAYRLRDGWTISGLRDFEDGKLKRIAGWWSAAKPSRQAPALVSMTFEIEPRPADCLRT